MNARIPLPAGTASVEPADPCTSPLLEDAADGLLGRLLLQPADTTQRGAPGGVVIAELLALGDNGNTPLLALPGQEGSATAALTVVDLHGGHVGMQVIVAFESGGGRPIVLGLVRGRPGWPLESPPPAQVDVDVDGQRMVVSAREQLVLRCGKASITLTKAGKVLIEGSYVLSRSSGVNRIKGGSVQMN